MFLNILDETRILLLKRIVKNPPVADAYLAGGTALALMFGHRESIDFDWFTPTMFEGNDIKTELERLGKVETIEIKKGAFHCFLDDIKLTWLYYPNPLPKEKVSIPACQRLNLISILDIAVMKWAAISGRGSRKDFIDLYFICHKGTTLKSLVPLFNLRGNCFY